jgi:hypothetical protein
MVAGMRISALARLSSGWTAWLALPVLAAVSSAASAHHSFAVYDLERAVTVDGTIASYEWRNPHVELTVRDEHGVLWSIETDAPATMTRSRWSRDTCAPGDPVSVRFNPNKDETITTGLLLTVRGANWVSRGSVARTGIPTMTTATATLVLAALVAAWATLKARRAQRPAPAAAALTGAGVLVWTLQFAFSQAALIAGVALLIAGAFGVRQTARPRPTAND